MVILVESPCRPLRKPTRLRKRDLRISLCRAFGASRTRRAVSIHRRIPAFQVIVDNSEVAAVETCIHSDDPPLRCLLKVDCGYHRAGLKPDDPELVRLAHRSDSHLRSN